MKKLSLFIMAFAISCAAFIALNGKANAAVVSVNAEEGEKTVSFEYDADGDKINDSFLSVTVDPNFDFTTIDRFFTRAVNVIVPDTIKVNYPSGVREFHPMLVKYVYPENGQALQSVTIPSSVKMIADKAFGFSSDGTRYDRNIREFQTPVYGGKLSGFKVICPENSAAETYAKQNGFATEILANTLEPLNIKVVLKTSSYTYTGAEICPEYTLTDSLGTNVICNYAYNTGKYKIVYRSNTNAGIGELAAVSTTSVDELTLARFSINKANAANDPNFKINNIGKAQFNGNLTVPSVEVTYKSVPLKESTDYVISTDSSSVANGKAKGAVIFLGNYGGSLPIEFEVEETSSPITGFNAERTENGVSLRWNPISNRSLVCIYRVNKNTNEASLISVLNKTGGDSYIDTAAPVSEDSEYYIQVNVTENDKTVSYTSKRINVPAKYGNPKATTLTIGNGQVTLSWSRVAADGYIVSMDGKQIYDTQSGDITSYTKTGLKNYEKHVFTVKPYTKSNGKIICGPESEQFSTLGVDSIINSAQTSDTRSFNVINVQKSNTTTSKIELTDNDVAILEKFAKEHFTADMTDAQKLKTTLNWINRNLKYASAASDWNKINGKSYTEAVFTYKLGQCVQYNGAMVSMMRYLGYEANLIAGWRGTWKTNYWQHYWGEVEVDGLKYIIEAGNYGKSGSWSYLLVPYERADRRYIVNCKNI